MQLQELFCKVTIPAFVLTSSLIAHGQGAWNFPDFSATQVLESRKADISMKVYLAGDSVRVERSGALSTLYVTLRTGLKEASSWSCPIARDCSSKASRCAAGR